MYKYLLIFLTASCSLLSKGNRFAETRIVDIDTSYLLSNNSCKYWDRIDTFTKYKVVDNINWCFFGDHTILEYQYDRDNPEKRNEYVYGWDIIYGRIPYEINSDTLKLLKHSLHLIEKLTIDTLILTEIVDGKPGGRAVYMQSNDQKQVPAPFFAS